MRRGWAYKDNLFRKLSSERKGNGKFAEEEEVDERIIRDVFLAQFSPPKSSRERKLSNSLSFAFSLNNEKARVQSLQNLRNAAIMCSRNGEERRAVSLGSQASAFASPRPGTDFIEQTHDLNSPANLEILKLDNVESYFSSIFPEPEAKPLTSSEWNSAYSQGRPFMPLPAAAGRVSNTSIPTVRACSDPAWITPFSAAPMTASPDPWTLSPSSSKQGYSLSPPTTNSQTKEDVTMDRSVSSTTFIGEDVKDSRYEVITTPYYPYSVTSTSVAASYPPFSPYTCPSKSSFYQDRSKECYQCSASAYTTTLYKTSGGRSLCENCSQYAVQSPATRTSKNTKRRMAGSNKRQGTSCNNCGTQKTTLWRRDATGQAVCNACGLYYKLHQQNRPPNMKKDTIQSRNRKPGRKNTKKKVELDQMTGAGVPGARYPDHMISLQQQLPSHMLHPGQILPGKHEDMMTSLYSPTLIKQEQQYAYSMSAHHMMPPPPALSPLTLESSHSLSQHSISPHSITPNTTLNTLSPDTPSKDPVEQLGFLNQSR